MLSLNSNEKTGQSIDHSSVNKSSSIVRDSNQDLVI